MKVERDSTMRDYKNRLAAIVIRAMRETALNTLMDLKTRFEDTTVSGMYDGPAMLDDMRAKAKAALAAGDDETEKKAAAELEAWKARVPPGGCASKDMIAHWTHWRLYINPYMPVPLVIDTKPYNDFLVSTMSHMNINDRIWSVKERLKAAGTYNDTAAVIKAYSTMLGDLHDPQAAINGVYAAMNSNRAARDGDRARGPKYLPPGQLCAFGSCNIQHTDKYCWRSYKFGLNDEALPYNLYTKQRSLYDEIERDRMKDAKKHGVTYRPLRVPTPRKPKAAGESAPSAAPVKLVAPDAGSVQAGGGLCDLFGTLGNGINLVDFGGSPSPDPDEMARSLGFEDDKYESDEDVPAASPSPSKSTVSPKSATTTVERGEWYAVPGGPKIGVEYVPLGSYHVLLAPYVVPGLHPVRCSSKAAAETKFKELQQLKSVVARHARWLDDSNGTWRERWLHDSNESGPTETATSKPGGLSYRALSYVAGAVLGVALLIAMAAVVPTATSTITVAGALAPRSTAHSLGAIFEGATSFPAVNHSALAEMASRAEALTGVPG